MSVILQKRRVRKRKSIPNYTYLGCPMTKNRSPWCFRMCKPDSQNIGKCGRHAPHAFKGRIQQGIIDFEARKQDEE